MWLCVPHSSYRADEGPGLGMGQRERDKAGTNSKEGGQGQLRRAGSCFQGVFPGQIHRNLTPHPNTREARECPRGTHFLYQLQVQGLPDRFSISLEGMGSQDSA